MAVVYEKAEKDETLAFDATTSFAGGHFSYTRANLLKEDQSAQLVNCDVTKTGELRTRRGTAQIFGTGVVQADPGVYPGGAPARDYIQGLVHFTTPSIDEPLAVNGTYVHKWNGSAWVISSVGFSAADNRTRVHMVQGINKIYFADGVSNLTSWDATTSVDLGGATNAHPPAAPGWLTWFTNRLITTPTGVPDSLYFSQFLDGATWDRTKWSLRVGAGEGDVITGHIGWTDFTLVVFKRGSIWAVNCDPKLQTADTNNTIAGFDVKRLTKRVGCLAPATATQCGDDIYFLDSDRRVRTINHVVATENKSEASDDLSYPIQDYLDRINVSAINTSCGTFRNNKYWLSVPLDSATAPSHTFVYSLLTESWHGYWTGIVPTCFAQRTVSAVPRLMFGDSTGKIREHLDYVAEASEVPGTFQDSGTDIPVTVLTRAFTFNSPVCPKQPFNVRFEFNRSLAAAITQVVRDDSTAENLTTFDTVTGTVTIPVPLPFVLATAGVKHRAFVLQQFAPCYELQFKVITTGGKLAMRSIVASAFTNTMRLEE